jgi:4-amino-4-deoxy-L-arabinose transferase-like glycosyltransferase
MVPWCSFLGSVVGVTLLAQLMGAGPCGHGLAAVLCTTIPQGILEASGAKNDYVVAFLLLVLAYYLFSFKREPTLGNTLGVGGALGLAWLTKGTAYVFSPAILITGVFACPGKAKMTFLKRLPLVFAIALSLNSRFAQIWSSSKNCGKVSSSLCGAIPHEATGPPMNPQWEVACGEPVAEGESYDRTPDPDYGTCR